MSRRLAPIAAAALPRNGAVSRRVTIGLMGGSFNPAHDGHRHIARAALRRLGLSEVWWLVSPQNPLKSRDDMGALTTRLASARAVAKHPRIKVRDIERRLGTVYTSELIAWLVRRAPRARFVWLMGADNLRQFDSWYQWSRILHTVPVAVFDRPPYSLKALHGTAARRFARSRVAERRARSLPRMAPPAWVFFHTVRHSATASAIRASRPASRDGRAANGRAEG